MSKAPAGTIMARGFDWDAVSYPGRCIGTFATLRYGKSLTEAVRRPGTVPVYGTNGRCGWHAEGLAPGPGVILGRKGQGHLGVEWCESPFWVIDTAYYVELDERVADLRWFYFLTQYVGLDHLKTGEKPGLQRDVFQAQIVPFPPKPEQERIRDVLGALDDKIALNRRMNRTLEATAAALFRSWFVDFEPAVAKAEGQRALGVPAAVHAAMPDTFSDAEGWAVPRGWEVCSVGDLVTVAKDGVSPAAEPEAIFDHYSIPAFDESGLATREPGAAIRSGKFRVPVDGILLSKLNPQTPRIWWPAPPVHDHSVCSTEFLACVPREGVPREFIYALFRSEQFGESMASLVTGTSNSHQRAKPGDVLRLLVVRPPAPCMRSFAGIAGPLLARARASLLESRSLAALRDTLLPQLLSGTIRLRDAEHAVAVAV